MAPDHSTDPGVCNDADNYFWYNWQPFSNPQPEMFIPLPTEAITHAPSNTIASQNCRSGNIGTYNGWFLPFPLAAASPHEEDPAASVSAHNYFLHCSGDWHPLSYFGEGLSEPPSEVPQLEDFFSAHRASPPPLAETKTAAACYYGEEQRVKPGKSSSDDDSKSDRLSQSMPSFDGDSDANLARALPLPSVAFPPRGDVAEDGKSRSTALVGTAGQRSSSFRGVTRHRWTGRYEAHLWDNTCVREGVKRKGRQVYLGGYDREEKAARAYDLAALKYWGPTAATNFPVENYAPEIEEMKDVTRQEFVASLRRKSTGFSRGASVYRGVTRHHQHGRWQARIGRVAGNKDLYLGTFTTEEEAAEAYDIAAIKFRGLNAITNFELSRYNIEAIACTELPIGSSAKRLKFSPPTGNQDPKPELTVATAPDDGTAASFLHSLYQARPGSAAAMPAAPQLSWGSAQIE